MIRIGKESLCVQFRYLTLQLEKASFKMIYIFYYTVSKIFTFLTDRREAGSTLLLLMSGNHPTATITNITFVMTIAPVQHAKREASTYASASPVLPRQ